MRDYSTVRPRMWTHGTIKELKGDREAREMAFYLMTSPSSNLLGLYYLPLCTLRHELGYDDDEQVRVVMRRLISKHFLRYDEASETIWVVNMCREQVGDDPKATDNRIRGVLKEIRKYKKNPFYRAFCDHYSLVFGVTFEAPLEPLGSPSEAPRKPLGSPSEGQKNPGEAPPESGSGSGSGSGCKSAARQPLGEDLQRRPERFFPLLDELIRQEAGERGIKPSPRLMPAHQRAAGERIQELLDERVFETAEDAARALVKAAFAQNPARVSLAITEVAVEAPRRAPTRDDLKPKIFPKDRA